jgi:hypothetical protein
MQTQSDSGCVDFEKNEEFCGLSLVDTAISDQCANGLPWFENNMSIFQQQLLKNWGI